MVPPGLRLTGLIKEPLRLDERMEELKIIQIINFNQVAKGFGANMESKTVDEVCVDADNKIVTTPAYMYNGKFHEIQDGVGNMVQEMLKMV